eukprot:COSAG01_NODE_568_length_15370_cov_26.058018_6_plen_391_part_00
MSNETPTLNSEEIKRYARHLILPEVGIKGQETLKKSKVLMVGAGGLGSPLALYLAAAGVGTLGIVDFDVVDASNLQRQILHGSSTLGKSKLDSAKLRLKDLNPFVHLNLIHEQLSAKNALKIFKDYDVIADGTDNFPTRYLVNDACVLSKKPNVYASIFRFEGQLSVFHYEDGPCYRCVYPEPPPPGLVPSCAEGGVLGVLPGVMGSLQANEVIKVLLNIGKPASGRLVMYDALDLTFRTLKLRKDPNCPICAKQPSQDKLIDYEQFCGIPEQSAKDAKLQQQPSMDVHALKQELDQQPANFILIDVREPHEADICRIQDACLVPLNQVSAYLAALPKADQKKRFAIHCKSGLRSAKAVAMFIEQGLDAHNVSGGILAWAQKIDSKMQSY